ncbi:hypothetical protein KFK09_019432 [Dendrobium nobile]|uniref:Uncharacterized protein n=1 Tax=Dendrobium nobile TaxID=94219 RepID=A0A8T3AR91_DENNO|nr:hypothetical protein KFK09_019432 [Dendrobium nobile]
MLYVPLHGFVPEFLLFVFALKMSISLSYNMFIVTCVAILLCLFCLEGWCFLWMIMQFFMYASTSYGDWVVVIAFIIYLPKYMNSIFSCGIESAHQLVIMGAFSCCMCLISFHDFLMLLSTFFAVLSFSFYFL